MQADRFVTAATWLDNARIDIALASEIADRYPSRSCFHALQSAELALEALPIAPTDDYPRSQIADVLIRELQALNVKVPVQVVTAANRLDLFYMGSRYPDAPGGADPSKVLQSSDALSATELARHVLSFVENTRARLAPDPSDG